MQGSPYPYMGLFLTPTTIYPYTRLFLITCKNRRFLVCDDFGEGMFLVESDMFQRLVQTTYSQDTLHVCPDCPNGSSTSEIHDVADHKTWPELYGGSWQHTLTVSHGKQGIVVDAEAGSGGADTPWQDWQVPCCDSRFSHQPRTCSWRWQDVFCAADRPHFLQLSPDLRD